MTTKTIDNPNHYNYGSKEVIDVIDENLGKEGSFGYCVGNAIKYFARRNHKRSRYIDVGKAKWYLRRALKCIDEEPMDDPNLDLFMYDFVVEAMSDEGKYELLCSNAYECLIEGDLQKAYAFAELADNMVDYNTIGLKVMNFTTYLSEYCRHS